MARRLHLFPIAEKTSFFETPSAGLNILPGVSTFVFLFNSKLSFVLPTRVGTGLPGTRYTVEAHRSVFAPLPIVCKIGLKIPPDFVFFRLPVTCVHLAFLCLIFGNVRY